MSTLASAALSSYIARQVTTGQPVVFDEIIFCNIPNLTTNNLASHLTMPNSNQIVYRQVVSQVGFVNENAVVYSVTMGTEIGDFDFNYIGLINRQLNLLAVGVYTNTIKKIKNKNGIQGNAITRSILLEFANAKQITNITIPAQTWQIDFTARLSGIDEKIRLTNRDLYGRAIFFDDGFLVKRKTGNQFSIQAGVAYIEGVRASIATAQDITASLPCSIYLDVVHHCTVTGAYQTDIKFLKQHQNDYVDSAGRQHYVQILADIARNGDITDRRERDKKYIPIEDKSDATDSDSSDTVATSKAAKTAYDKAVEAKNAADNAQQTANTKQSPATTLAGYGITNFKIELSTGNANDFKVDGNYYFANGQDLPDTGAWHIEVVSGGQANAVRQIARKANDTKIKTRFFNGLSWSPWKDAGGDGVPLGAVVAFPKDITHPQGFLLANGTTFSQQTYPDLYRTLGNKNILPNLQRSDVGMTAYFAADNIPDGWIPFDSIRTTVTQQNYPELYQHLTTKYRSISSVPLAEDRFIRNAGSGLTIGSVQGDAIRDIRGRLTTYRRTDRNDLVMPSGAFAKVRTQNGSMGNGGWDDWAMEVDFSASRVVPTANENRPKSIVLKLCIKAKNSFDDVRFWIKAFGEVENVGVLDAGRLAQDIQQVRAEKAGLNHTHTYNQITDFEQGVLRYLRQGFTQNLSETGWTKLPNGLIFQWGRINRQGAFYEQVTYPISFKAKLLNLSVNQIYLNNDNNQYREYGVGVKHQNLSGFKVNQTEHDGVTGIYWFAIGV